MDSITSFGYADEDLEQAVRVEKRKNEAGDKGKEKGEENVARQMWEMEPKKGNSESSSQEPKGDHVSIQVDREEDHFKKMRETLSLYKDYDEKPYWDVISQVPEKLRKINEAAYTPRVVSIGPRHHGAPHLQAMEPYKWRCLYRYLERSSLNLVRVSQIATKDEKRVRLLYQDKFNNITGKGFSQMIMLDCVFMIELFIDNYNGLKRSSPEGEKPKKIFDDPWMERDILHDMMLLENQLPYVIIRDLFEAGFLPGTIDPLHNLVHMYFKKVGFMDRLPPKDWPSNHLVDFLRCCHCPKYATLRKASRRGKLECTRRATELQEAGVRFTKEEAESGLLHIHFSTDGQLTIPQLTVNEWSETFFRNLIAFEQCRRCGTQYITSFVILMDSLMKTPKDVDLLVNCGIIENSLGDNEQVWSLFCNLHKEIVMDEKDFYFAHICEDLNNYSKDWWHQWKAAWFRWKLILRRDYFSNPWSTISVIAAVILLVLTGLQTAYSIK